MSLKWSRCVATVLVCVIDLTAIAGNVNTGILVDPVFDDDDGSTLLFPVPAVPHAPVRQLRAVAKSRTLPLQLHAFHASSNNVKDSRHTQVLQPSRDVAAASSASQRLQASSSVAADQKPETNQSEPMSNASNQERMNRLLDSLIGPRSHYHKALRPLPDCSAHDCSHKIGVTMSLEFQKLLGVDEIHNQLEMLALLTLNWPDHRLSYNSSDWFPHLFDWQSENDFVAIDPHLIWKPDIQLVNAAVPMKHIFEPRAYLYDDRNRLQKGFNIQLKVPNIIKVKCDLLMNEFPFDNQTCAFVYQAWSATSDWISFTAGNTSVANETIAGLTSKNEEFQVTSVAMKDSTTTRNGQEFPQIIYTLTLRRYSHYYVSSIILPMLMMVLLSVGVFYIDPPGGERLGYNITLILTVMATSFFAAERLPKSGGGDTWLERFQAGCYIITILPLVVSLFCELGRRMAHKLEMAGDDDAGWVTHSVDVIFRVPYAFGTAIFIYMVSAKFMASSDSTEESVLALLIFIFAVIVVMCIVGIADLFIEFRRRSVEK